MSDVESQDRCGPRTPTSDAGHQNAKVGACITSPGSGLLALLRFLEMAETDPAVEALAYLQHDLHAEVDHDDAQESKDFHALLKHLLGRGSQPLESKLLQNPRSHSPADLNQAQHQARSEAVAQHSTKSCNSSLFVTKSPRWTWEI